MARLLRLAFAAGVLALGAGCASGSAAALADLPTAPLPTSGLAGREVAVYPLTMLLAEVDLEWDGQLTPKSVALATADSLIAIALTDRTPEVTWVLPDRLRRAAAAAPGLLPDPDRMATALLRGRMLRVPDPLRGEMRLLTGTVGDRLALVPASLFFFVSDSTDGGRAELTITLADVRTGTIGWQTVAKGTGGDPWSALRNALNSLAPGLP